MAYQIISDGSCDLPPELARQKNIHVVPFYVSFDGVHYKKEIEEVNIREFYQEMIDRPGVYPKSSLPSVQDYINAFTPYVSQGIPILCICISTKFSGSRESAKSAADILSETYPDCQIHVTDAAMNTVLQGLLVLEAASFKDSGASYEECITCVERIKETGRIFFTIGSMDYLRKGGRIGRLAGLAADTLGIKPLILLKEGDIFPVGITRSRKKAKEKLAAQEPLPDTRNEKEEPRTHSVRSSFLFLLSPLSSDTCQAVPKSTSRNRAARPVICFRRRISSLSIPRCFEIHASECPSSCSSLTILLIRSTLCEPLARLCRIVLAMRQSIGLSITETGSRPPSRS